VLAVAEHEKPGFSPGARAPQQAVLQRIKSCVLSRYLERCLTRSDECYCTRGELSADERIGDEARPRVARDRGRD
jgi:hypothetical protein